MFKSIRALGLALVTSFPLVATADSLEVVVQGITKASGSIRIAVYDGEPSFKKLEAPVVGTIIPAAVPSVSFETELPAGEYAISLFHDVDGNGKLKTNLVGMPREPYGFSNNAKGKFGPPTWAASVFTVDGDTTVVIDFGH